LGMVCLVEVVLKPGKRACPPLATPASAGRFVTLLKTNQFARLVSPPFI
jgi:hypothetical protein